MFSSSVCEKLICTTFLSVVLSVFSISSSADASEQPKVQKEIPFYGVVNYFAPKPIYSQFSGVITEIYVQGGERLSEGQPLVKVDRLEFGFAPIVLKNNIDNAIVSRVNYKGGHKIERLSEIMVLADASDLMVTINISQFDLENLASIENALVVFLPNSDSPITKRGKITAIHEPPQGQFGLYSLEIQIDCGACTSKIKSGSIAKVILESKALSSAKSTS